MKSVTFILPKVKVPVLSNATQLIFDALCNDEPRLISTPYFAATPVATNTAVGVAKPNAQGHALTHTAKENKKLNIYLLSYFSLYHSTGILSVPAAINQVNNDNNDIIATIGTNHSATLSAYSCIAGLSFCVCCTYDGNISKIKSLGWSWS